MGECLRRFANLDSSPLLAPALHLPRLYSLLLHLAVLHSCFTYIACFSTRHASVRPPQSAPTLVLCKRRVCACNPSIPYSPSSLIPCLTFCVNSCPFRPAPIYIEDLSLFVASSEMVDGFPGPPITPFLLEPFDASAMSYFGCPSTITA